MCLVLACYDVIFSFSEDSKETFEKLEGVDCLEELQNDTSSNEELIREVHQILNNHFDGYEENTGMIDKSGSPTD